MSINEKDTINAGLSHRLRPINLQVVNYLLRTIDKSFTRTQTAAIYIFDNNFLDLTRQDNITQMNELVKEFINTKEEKRLKQLIHDMVNLSDSFQDELLWRRPVMKVLIPVIADILFENIPAIADGSIESMSDHDVKQALDEFTSMAESSVDT